MEWKPLPLDGIVMCRAYGANTKNTGEAIIIGVGLAKEEAQVFGAAVYGPAQFHNRLPRPQKARFASGRN
ncbi:hypothetical protein GCM10007285_28080 [Stappia taiwanensis]|nr:hypothetical protein GCM10007285_28080 [Stappia taiwanensis]